MADNTVQSGTDTIATDDVTTLNGGASSGVKVQRVKVTYGDDGTARDVSASFPLPAFHPDTVSSAATLSALNAAATISLSGQSTISFFVSGTYSGTLTFEGQYPDGSWVNQSAYQGGDGNALLNMSATGIALRAVNYGFIAFRVRMSSYTSGSAVVTLNASHAVTPLPVPPVQSDGGTFADSRTGTVVMGRTAGSGASAVAKQIITDATGRLITTDLLDTSRTSVVLSAAGVASVTAVALMSLNQYVGGTVTAGVTTYTVPAGKTLRIQTIQFGARFTTPSTTVTFASTTFALRFVTTGTTVVGSPILHQDSKLAASNMPTPNSDMAIPMGLDIPAGYNIGVTHLASGAVLSEDVAIVGFLF